MEVDGQALLDLFGELYPKELKHVLAELRARTAEQQLAEFQSQHSGQEQSPSEDTDG